MSVAAGRVAEERRAEDRVRRPTTLVVDDSRAVRRILRGHLEAAGYLVEEAGDGQAALTACRDLRPDLVLLDVDMPVMDGLEALAAMRADESLRQVPVLFLTARIGGSDVARGLELGAQDYLRKPCEPAELLARVASALRSSERHDALAHQAREAARASTTDPLTGLGNRRHLEARVAELRTGPGPAARAGVLLLDVDHFKRINDERGHQVGDVVLRILARRLLGTVGEHAALVRWGGEEFLALAPDAAGVEPAELAEQLRVAVARTPFAVGPDDVLPVTVSVGWAAGTLDAFDTLVEGADRALYAAKRAGRDRVAGGPV